MQTCVSSVVCFDFDLLKKLNKHTRIKTNTFSTKMHVLKTQAPHKFGFSIQE